MQNYSAGVVWNHGCLTVEQGEDALSLKLARVVVGRIDFFMDCGSGSLSVACRVSISVGQFQEWLHCYMPIRQQGRASHTKESGFCHFISTSTLLPCPVV